jgi:predicted RNase H-like HicB family nuclease
VTVPDLSGCFSAGETLDEVLNEVGCRSKKETG